MRQAQEDRYARRDFVRISLNPGLQKIDAALAPRVDRRGC